MPSLEWNLRLWDKDYAWPADGDEWTEAAAFSGVPYPRWKEELAQAFIAPALRPEHTALELGPGHGRWSEILARHVSRGRLLLVDISPSCLSFCRRRFAALENVSYHENDGRSLSFVAAEAVDFIWSYDTFVHIEKPELVAYAREFARILKRRAMGILHHPGTPTPQQRQAGCRSAIDSSEVASALRSLGLVVIRQTDSWGSGSNVKLAGDALTVFVKP